MTLLKTFATLSLISGALLVLLPEGSLRKTTALVVGLMLTLCWAEGLMDFLRPPEGGALPDSPLSVTGTTVEQTAADAAETLAEHLPPEVTEAP